ncbi:transposase [Carnobacterium maltaromaticum]|uniref:transposase n=1 Tax=Carnobacterium maltaromaticum TaxID=2751 RepID=UPI0009B79A8B
MLKVLLYSYTQNQFPGRKIERMMTDSIRMMWLAHHEVVSYCRLNRLRATPHTAALFQECFNFVLNSLKQI